MLISLKDFRSEEGLYSLIQAQRDAVSPKKSQSSPQRRSMLAQRRHQNPAPVKQPVTGQPCIPTNIKGKDLFDAQLWKDPTSTSVFYTFIASLRKKIRENVKKTTPTHRFIRTLRDKRKLVRCYTQNIDGLEAREGLCVDMDRGKGTRSRFTKQSMEKPRIPARVIPGGDLDGGCEVVQLHGDLNTLRCTLCQQTCSWDDDERETRLLAGKAPTCQSCETMNLDRQDRGKRGTKIGTLRPNIVLYGEEHPSADAVGTITANDLALSPHVLLILGTSLHVHGLKVLVKEFSKSVHARAGGKGKVILVNLSKPSESAWKDMFDYWVSMDCDQWVAAMRRHRPDLFQVQDELKLSVTKGARANQTSKVTASPFFAKKADEDKENVGNPLVSTPRKKTAQPLVVVSPKRSPASVRVFAKDDQRSAIFSMTNTKGRVQNPVNQSQLPTPPSSGHKSRTETPSRKRSLAETYSDMCDTPSQKRRKGTLCIWEDPDADV